MVQQFECSHFNGHPFTRDMMVWCGCDVDHVQVYNATQRSTFESLKGWNRAAKEDAPADAMFMLVGTCADEEPPKKTVTTAEGEVGGKNGRKKESSGSL